MEVERRAPQLKRASFLSTTTVATRAVLRPGCTGRVANPIPIKVKRERVSKEQLLPKLSPSLSHSLYFIARAHLCVCMTQHSSKM